MDNREAARAFITDYPRPEGKVWREPWWCVLKDILRGHYTYDTQEKRLVVVPYVQPDVPMPVITDTMTKVPDIEVPFKWRDGMPTGKDIAQIEAAPRQPPHGAINGNGGFKVRDNQLPIKPPPEVRIDF